VRIAMTVGEAGERPGELRLATAEEPNEDGSSLVTFAVQTGRIAADLTTGADVAGAVELKSNEGLAVERALQAAARPVTPAQLARHFLRANPADLAEILATLATLGRAHREGESYTA